MGFILKILGSNAAAPAFNRNQTAQILNINGKNFLIDCGEATQLRLKRVNVRINKIDHIFISHLHGDHYFGLIGLLSTMHLFGRKKEINLFCPSPLQEIIELQLRYSDTRLNYTINYFFTDKTDESIIFETKDVIVEKFPLDHGIFCTGFLFREKPKSRKIQKDKLPDSFHISDMVKLKMGEDILDEDGNVIFKNEDYTLPPPEPKSYAYCSDTKYDESLISIIRSVDLLYHEATFMNDMKQRAGDTFHSTAEQAATIAKKAGVDKLLLGHFSVRYRELEPVLEEALKVFKNTRLAIEGEFYEVN
ncbi:ribonuclease Z [Bacteroidota bacterium]